MPTFTQSFLLFAAVYATAFFFITNFSYEGLNIQDGISLLQTTLPTLVDPDFMGAKTFFTAHETNDDFEIIEKEEDKYIEFNEDIARDISEFKPEEIFELKVKVTDDDSGEVKVEDTTPVKAQDKVKQDTVKATTNKTGSGQGITLISDKTKPNTTEKPSIANPSQPNIRPNPFATLGAYPDPTPYVTKPRYDKPHYGIINYDRYCHEVDIYNLANPSNMFNKMNFLTDYPTNSIVRTKVLSKIGAIYLSQISRSMSKNVSQSRTYPLDRRITTFHISGDRFYKYHEIGKHYLCATQMFNHIPNHTTLIRKDEVLQNIADYSLMYKDKPQCFDKNSFFPETYRLFVKEECEDFFKLIRSEKYKDSLKDEPIQYLLKVGHGAHKAQGVFLLDTNETKSLNTDYEEGKKCGEVTKPWIAQKYITNPLLLDSNNKFHMRVYVLIASTNPFIVYYHDGYIRASIFPFDKHSEDRATHLTNLLVGDQVAGALNNTNTKGMTAKQLEDYYLWSFEDLEKYLLESGKITDENWLDNHLRPALQKAFVHIVRMTGGYFWKQSNVFELFGCDFMLDDEMNVWFIEANPNPLLDGVKPQMITTMLKDMFEIEYGYYRSRMKRVLSVIQSMEKENGMYGPVKGLGKWKKLYQQAMKNRLEPEYKIKGNNTFKLIMDESLPGAQAYLGYIPEECVNQE